MVTYRYISFPCIPPPREEHMINSKKETCQDPSISGRSFVSQIMFINNVLLPSNELTALAKYILTALRLQ